MTIKNRVKIQKVLLLLAIIAVVSIIAFPVVYSPSMNVMANEINKMQTQTEQITLLKGLFGLVGILFCIVGYMFVRLISKYDDQHKEHSQELKRLHPRVYPSGGMISGGIFR